MVINKKELRNLIKEELKKIMKESSDDTIKVPIKLNSAESASLDKARKNSGPSVDTDLDTIVKILARYKFEYEGKSYGAHGSEYWTYKGSEYKRNQTYRLTGDYELESSPNHNNFIELEEFQANTSHWR